MKMVIKILQVEILSLKEELLDYASAFPYLGHRISPSGA